MKIQLNRGYEAIIDAEDYSYIDGCTWFLSKKGYAVATIYLGGGRMKQKCKTIYMHRLINQTTDDMETDHINRNKLDNRKSNLRSVTPSQNQIHKLPQKNKVSRFKGVCWDKQSRKWKAQLIFNGKRVLSATFKTEEEAAMAYNNQAHKFFGRFAYLNEVA